MPLESEPSFDGEDALDRIAQQHDASILDEELAKLPETYRSVILMQVYHEASVQKLADHFQTTIGVVRGRLHRGKRQLARQLRRRGVIPVVAMTATLATRASHAESSVLVRGVETLIDQPLPPTPSPPPDLTPLLSTGTSVMTTLKVTGAVAAFVAVAAFLASSPSEATDNSEFLTVQFSAPVQGEEASTGSAFLLSDDTGASSLRKPATRDMDKLTAETETARTSDTPRSLVAQKLIAELDAVQTFSIQADIGYIASELQKELKQPVFLDRKALEIVQASPDTVVETVVEELPLRSALHQLLSPYRLKAVVRDHGLVILPDFEELVRDGISTDRWVEPEEIHVLKAASALETNVTFHFLDTPLDEALTAISESVDQPILLDQIAMEEIGLAADTPVTISLREVSMDSFMAIMLKPLDMCCAMVDNHLVVTTNEAAVTQLATRIYFLEGLGITIDGHSDPAAQALSNAIQASVSPENWETVGGTCTIAAVPGARPSFVISATFPMHLRIERLINALRESQSATSSDSSLSQRSPSRPAASGGRPATKASASEDPFAGDPFSRDPAESDPFGGTRPPNPPASGGFF